MMKACEVREDWGSVETSKGIHIYIYLCRAELRDTSEEGACDRLDWLLRLNLMDWPISGD